MTGYGVHPCEEMLSAASPVRGANQARSPASLRRYQLEQNPDLINGTESIGCRREGDGEDERNQEAFQGERVVAGPFPIACLRGSAEFYSDIRSVCIHSAFLPFSSPIHILFPYEFPEKLPLKCAALPDEFRK